MTLTKSRWHRRRHVAEWLFLMIALLTLGASITYAQLRERTIILTEQRDRLASQTNVVEKNMRDHVFSVRRTVDGILENLPVWQQQNNGFRQANRQLENITDALPGVRTLSIINEQGRVLASSHTALLGTNFAGQDYFLKARQGGNPQILYITPPITTAHPKVVMQLYRVIQGVDGKFSGIVVASVDRDFFNTVLDSIRYTADVWSIVAHGDGKVFMANPDRPELVGKDLSKSDNFFARHRDSSQTENMFSGLITATGEHRLMATRTMQPLHLAMDRPLIIAVSRDTHAILANWRQQNYEYLGIFGLLALIAAAGLHLYQRRQHVYETLAENHAQLLRSSEARLQSFFDASPDALLISDTQGVITMANNQVEPLLGYTVQELVGLSIEELVPDRSREKHPDMRAGFAASPNARRMGHGLAVQARRKNGSTCDVEVSLSRIQTDQGLFFACALRDITESKLAKEQLRIAAVAFESHQGIVVTDAADIILRSNQAFTKITGYTAEEAVGKRMHFLKSDHHDDRFYTDMWANILRDGAWEGEIWNRNKNGEVHPHWLTIAAVKDNEGATSHYIGTYTDITDIKAAAEDLRIAAVAFESNQAMLITDANSRILRVNQAFVDITGYGAEEVVGKTPKILQSGRHDRDFYREMWDTITRTGGWNGEIWDRRKNGELYPKWLTISAVKDDAGHVTHYIGSHFDISERKKSEELIHSLAFFDQLTGLPNRTLLTDRLKQAMTASGRSGLYGALLFIDLDNFKSLNDTLGHDMGDLLLQQVAQRLSLCGREGDTVARLGGDEFVVVLAALSGDMADAANATEIVAKKYLYALNQIYHLGDVSHRSTASIGATIFQGQKVSLDELMKQADLALYRSKDAGRNALRFFDPSMELAVKKRVALEEDMREALLAEQFSLQYQAQVTVNGEVTGAEVLLRWNHPTHGMVSPAEFIPLAEETGLILPLGYWVLKTVCKQLAQWAGNPDMAHLTIAVNVSVHQFNDTDFVGQVLALLESSGINPERLKLELTESLMAGKVQKIIDKMTLLKERSIQFSIDDFGTGYSSLSYLKRLPIDQLKIDQSFVRDVLTDPNDAAIVKTIVALGRTLGLDVIAEGVETQAQRNFLVESGCQVYQGYFFSRPVPVAEFEQFVRTTQSAHTLA